MEFREANRFWPSGEAKSVNEDDHETVFHIFGNNDVMIFTKLVNMQNNSVHTSHRQNPRTKPNGDNHRSSIPMASRTNDNGAMVQRLGCLHLNRMSLICVKHTYQQDVIQKKMMRFTSIHQTWRFLKFRFVLKIPKKNTSLAISRAKKRREIGPTWPRGRNVSQSDLLVIEDQFSPWFYPLVNYGKSPCLMGK